MSEQQIAEVFVELADTLVDRFDVVDFLQTLTERCVELLEASAAGIMLANADGRLQLVAGTSTVTRKLELFELQVDHGPCVDAFRTCQAVLNVDLRESHRTWPAFTAAAITSGVRTTSALPLRLRGQVLGALNLFSNRHDSLSRSKLRLGQAMADVATIGLLHERPLRRKVLLSEQLRGALQSRVTIEQAKGVLAVQAGITVTDASDVLRRHAHRSGRALTDVARAVVAGTLDLRATAQDTTGERVLPVGVDDPARPALSPDGLSELDVEILRLLEVGTSTVMIAVTHRLSLTELAERLTRTRTSLRVRSTAAAVQRARQLGLL